MNWEHLATMAFGQMVPKRWDDGETTVAEYDLPDYHVIIEWDMDSRPIKITGVTIYEKG